MSEGGNEMPLVQTAEQELSAKFFERVDRMANASKILADKTAPLSEPFPDIDLETVEEIDAVFDRISDLALSGENPNFDQLFDREVGPIYWEKIGAKFGVDGKMIKKLHERYLAEIELLLMLRMYSRKRFGALRLEDMHQFWFYETRDSRFEGIKMSFAGWMRTNGLPEIYSGCLVVPEKMWQKEMDGGKTFGDILYGKELTQDQYLGGLYFTPSKIKESDNPLDVLGLVLVREGGGLIDEKSDDDAKAKRLLIALHENMHQLDLLADERHGDDRLISEIIAFRSKLYYASKQRVSGHANNFDFDYMCNNLILNYVKREENETAADFERRQKKVEEAFNAYEALESTLSIPAVGHILMNCRTLDQLIAWRFDLEKGEDIEKYSEWKETAEK